MSHKITVGLQQKVTSARVQAEGGYEAKWIVAKWIVGKGIFAPQTQTVLVEKVHQLADQVGREIPGDPGGREQPQP